jgi:hypothetical protein
VDVEGEFSVVEPEELVQRQGPGPVDETIDGEAPI